MVLQGFLGALIQLLGIGAGGTLFLSSSPMIPALVLNSFLTNPGDDISLWSYTIGLVTPLVTGTVLLLSVLDVFVPLVSSLTNLHCYIGTLNVRLQTGRIGEEAPAEFIIATIVAITSSYILPLTVPFVHRFSRRILIRLVIFTSMVTGLAMAIFSMRSPFDPMHQKRLFVIHMENVSVLSECL